MLGNFSTSRCEDREMTEDQSDSRYVPIDQHTEHYTKAVDIFALGCVWWEQITLQPLFKDETKIAKRKVPKFRLPPSLEMNLDIRFIELIKRMTSHNPLERPTIGQIINNNFIRKYSSKRILIL